METSPFTIERTYDAPSSRVWDAITDKDKMKQWYFDIAAFKPEVGFEFSFIGGDEKKQYVHLCKIKEVIIGKKLSYTWKYEGFEGESLVTFELFPEGERTRLLLTHEGLETFKTGDPSFRRESFAEGWTFIIGQSLKEFVEK
jgi:uncharacterized protein YndB with AHSA1/START domain